MANAPEKHAKLSPSSAEKWLNCPASIAMEEGIPDRSTSYADEGTVAHQLAAWTLQDRAHRCDAYLGRIITLNDKDWEIDEEMCENVQSYVDAVLHAAEGHTLLVEQPLPIGHLTGEEDAEGTGDAIIITNCGTRLHVRDLKYGHRPVTANRNKQLMTYALGALEKYGMLGDFEEVVLAIHQPRVSDLPSEFTISVADLRGFKPTVEQAAAKAWAAIELGKENLPAEMFKPGKKTCEWCKAQGTCPAARRTVVEIVMGEFDNMDDPQRVLEESKTTSVDPKAFAPEWLSVCLEMSEFIENWLKAVRGAVEATMFQGGSVPGYKLVQGKQGNRAWKDKVAAENLLKSFRLTIEEMYALKLISPTQAEKLLKKENPRRWKKLQDLISRSEGQPSVAPESDPRPALVLAPASDDFETVAEGNDWEDLA